MQGVSTLRAVIRDPSDRLFSDCRVGVDTVRDFSHPISFLEAQPIACHPSRSVSLGFCWYLATFGKRLSVCVGVEWRDEYIGWFFVPPEPGFRCCLFVHC